MNKLYTSQVLALRKEFIDKIESTFEKNVVIEFNTPFTVYIEEDNSYDESINKVPYIVKTYDGLYLSGTTFFGDEFDDLSVADLADIIEVAHILDKITLGHYKILSNG
jgi:UDP-N-acetyl-D-mannosaminuronic acid transferase (WecB/TagA/CpsF family)